MHLLASLLLVVLSLHVLELTSQSFDLIFVLVNLSLIHIEFSSHCLHLRSLFLQILLIDGKLLSSLWSGLSGKKVFKLNIEVLLLLNKGVSFNNLFGLLDKSSLESMDFLDHLPSFRVSTRKSSPSVAIERILKLLRECLDL